MEEKYKSLLAFVATALGVAKSDVEAKLEDATGESELLDLHKQKVQEQKKTNFDDGYKKANKEVKYAFEKDLKEKFDLNSDKTGLDLVEELLTVKGKEAAPGEVTEDVIKKHPLYLAKEKEVANVAKNVEKEWQTKLTELEKAQAKKEAFKTVSERALTAFEKLNPVLSADPEKANRQKKLIIERLEKFDFEINGDNLLILEAEGKRKEDGHGNPYKFEDLVKQTADDLGFDYKVAEERSSSGGGSNTGNTGGAPERKFKGELPKTPDDYLKIITDSSIPLEQRLEVKEVFEKETSNV
jgi:hypothetical protein